jgi:hypothetical protein
MTCKINASTTGAGGLLVEGDSSGALDLQSNGVTKVSFDANGNMTTSGTIPAGALTGNVSSSLLSGNLPALNGSALTSLSAPNLTGALPALNGSALTSLSAPNLTGALPAIDGSSLTGIESFSYLTHSITTTTTNRSLSSSFVTHLTRSFTVPSGKNATLIATVGAYGMQEGSNGQVAARITVSGASSQTGTTIIGHRGTFSGYAGEMNITQAFRLTNSGSHTVNFQVKNQGGAVTMNGHTNGIDYLHILVFQD